MWYQKSVGDALSTLHSGTEGLTNTESQRRLQTYGPNRIMVRGKRWWQALVEPFKSVFVLVLLVAGVLSLVRGEKLDASIIFLIIGINTTIYYVQQFSAARVLRALRRQDIQNVRVIRDGKERLVASEQLVPGDIIILSEGEKVPADTRLINASNVRADESLLTGESAPVDKHAAALSGEKPIFEQRNMLFQGAFVISGEALALVVDTGNNTEFGKIAELAEEAQQESPAQQKIDKLVTQLIAVISGVAVVVFLLSIWRGISLSEAFHFVISLTVSAVPEDLPIAISIILVLGMRQLAKRRALVRSLAAIENIGIVTSIATDKTGTLTMNKLTVQEVWQLRKTKEFYQQIYLSANHNNGKTGDPLDAAFLAYTKSQDITHSAGRTLTAKLPFDQKLAMSGNIWQEGNVFEVLVKGAPEHIIRRSHVTNADRLKVEAKLKELTSQGSRVVAVARLAPLGRAVANIAELPEKAFHFLGLISVADILRPDAASSIALAQAAGVDVRMITGDHFETAFAIGKKLGLAKHRDQVLDARALHALSDKKLAEVIETTRVFARVSPESKFRILGALQKNHITAMTGDGVNDVPALARAHIGIAMGSGTQIAREAGDIVLLNDSFRSIVEAIRGGRVIFDNIRRMVFYLLSTSLGEVLTMIGALIIGLPLPVLAVQILWINLVTDTCLVIPLGLEPAEDNVMKRPPRRANQSILDNYLIWRLAFIGLAMAVVTLLVFYYFLETHGLAYAQVIAFNVLVVMQWANAFNARSEWQSLFKRLRHSNNKLLLGMAIAMFLQGLVLFGPLGAWLHISPVALGDILLSGGIGALAILGVGELHKLHYTRRSKRIVA